MHAPTEPESLPSLDPDIRLFGPVSGNMIGEFLRQREGAEGSGPLVVELSTEGGDADSARRIAQEIRLLQRERAVYFVGKTYVYSAGVTIMAAVPRARRFLTNDTQLLIHERKLGKTLRLDGSLGACETILRNALEEVEAGQRLERASFIELVEGSTLDIEALEAKVFDHDWYLSADMAWRLGLVHGLV